jgi:hypothetical protein
MVPFYLDSTFYIIWKDDTLDMKSVGPISSLFFPLDGIIFSPKDEPSQVVDNSSPGSIPTKPQIVFHSI